MSYSCIFLSFLMIITCGCNVLYQSENSSESESPSQARYRVMFWNVENLFDTRNDSLTLDDEFTPEGIRRWGYSRYKHKINNVYKVLSSAGNPAPPEIIGLCEIENLGVLLDITFNSPFLRHGYSIVHSDSPDRRGIDVAVLYDPGRVRLLNRDFISPYHDGKGPAQTREIVYIEAIIHETDTVHLFFNHWPSKYGGAGYTEPLRKKAAETLKNYVDSLQSARKGSSIIIGGDFNDPPDAMSLAKVLGAVCAGQTGKDKDRLYNISCGARPGTHKYHGIWEVIDQFIVSGNMLNPQDDHSFVGVRFEIFARDFLLINDAVYSGTKPFRTWDGMRYAGGFSDHLPVMLEVY